MITGAQIRQARKLLNWDREQLARKARLRTRLIALGESVEGAPPLVADDLQALKHALEAAGVEFVDGPPGARLQGSRAEDAGTPAVAAPQARDVAGTAPCPICLSPAVLAELGADHERLVCSECGEFKISGTAMHVLVNQTATQRRAHLEEARLQTGPDGIPFIRSVSASVPPVQR
jgi:hypothetical protein